MEQADINIKPKKMGQIITTAEDLFQRFGFKRITIEEICSKAEVSKMTFYKYFQNKNELIKCIMDNWLGHIVKGLEDVSKMDITFTEKIRILLRLKEETNAKISKEFILEYMNPDNDMRIYFREFYDRAISIFIEFIKTAQFRGEVRKDIKPEFLIAMLNKMIEMAKDEPLVQLYPRAADFSLEINNFFYCGILPLETLDNRNDEKK
ncbi:MAG: TetR/AcrR family transcriptional regulator [Ignavibacteriaceae bacterium]|nr:TetR/AcrR family transcriptional regulator [Ignavibacteriaceae bacterium]